MISDFTLSVPLVPSTVSDALKCLVFFFFQRRSIRNTLHLNVWKLYPVRWIAKGFKMLYVFKKKKIRGKNLLHKIATELRYRINYTNGY